MLLMPTTNSFTRSSTVTTSDMTVSLVHHHYDDVLKTPQPEYDEEEQMLSMNPLLPADNLQRLRVLFQYSRNVLEGDLKANSELATRRISSFSHINHGKRPYHLHSYPWMQSQTKNEAFVSLPEDESFVFRNNNTSDGDVDRRRTSQPQPPQRDDLFVWVSKSEKDFQQQQQEQNKKRKKHTRDDDEMKEEQEEEREVLVGIQIDVRRHIYFPKAAEILYFYRSTLSNDIFYSGYSPRFRKMKSIYLGLESCFFNEVSPWFNSIMTTTIGYTSSLKSTYYWILDEMALQLEAQDVARYNHEEVYSAEWEESQSFSEYSTLQDIINYLQTLTKHIWIQSISLSPLSYLFLKQEDENNGDDEKKQEKAASDLFAVQYSGHRCGAAWLYFYRDTTSSNIDVSCYGPPHYYHQPRGHKTIQAKQKVIKSFPLYQHRPVTMIESRVRNVKRQNVTITNKKIRRKGLIMTAGKAQQFDDEQTELYIFDDQALKSLYGNCMEMKKIIIESERLSTRNKLPPKDQCRFSITQSLYQLMMALYKYDCLLRTHHKPLNIETWQNELWWLSDLKLTNYEDQLYCLLIGDKELKLGLQENLQHLHDEIEENKMKLDLFSPLQVIIMKHRLELDHLVCSFRSSTAVA